MLFERLVTGEPKRRTVEKKTSYYKEKINKQLVANDSPSTDGKTGDLWHRKYSQCANLS